VRIDRTGARRGQTDRGFVSSGAAATSSSSSSASGRVAFVTAQLLPFFSFFFLPFFKNIFYPFFSILSSSFLWSIFFKIGRVLNFFLFSFFLNLSFCYLKKF
jgi:hypothetical protein